MTKNEFLSQNMEEADVVTDAATQTEPGKLSASQAAGLPSLALILACSPGSSAYIQTATDGWFTCL